MNPSSALPRLSFSVDSVLADFPRAFTGLVNTRFLTDISPDWTEWEPAVFTPEQWQYGWDEVRHTSLFWVGLPVYPGTPMVELDLQMEKGLYLGYFLAQRTITGNGLYQDSTLQTLTWLALHGIRNYTGVFTDLDFEPVRLMEILHIDGHLEDRGDKFEQLIAAGAPCYLLDRPWNQKVDAGIYRVASVGEFVRQTLTRIHNGFIY